jgi:hypothetical protein
VEAGGHFGGLESAEVPRRRSPSHQRLKGGKVDSRRSTRWMTWHGAHVSRPYLWGIEIYVNLK